MAIYLDYAATTPTDDKVIEAMCGCMKLANPSSPYGAAAAARRQMRLARQLIARMLHADVAALYFTSGGSEANAWAMTYSPHAAVSAVEHASVLNSAPNAVRIPADANGLITAQAVARALRPDTELVSVQWANNETGVIHPIEEIYRVVKAHGAKLHVDAVQAFGHVPVDARHCDMMTLSAHKLYGPRGAGCLYVRPGVELNPLIPGGGQEGGWRGGTENVPAICGFGVAAQLAQADLEARAQRERALMAGFLAQIAVPGAYPLSADVPRLPGVAALYLPGLPAEIAIAKLDLLGVEVSGGAACHSRSAAPSHVYQAMGLSEDEAKHVIRVSIGRGVDEAQLTAAAAAINRVYTQK